MSNNARYITRQSRFIRVAACLALASLALQLGLRMVPMPMPAGSMAGDMVMSSVMSPDCDMTAMGEGGQGKGPMDPMSSCFICKALSSVPLALDVPVSTSWQRVFVANYQWQDGSSFSVSHLPRGFSSRAPPIPTFS